MDDAKPGDIYVDAQGKLWRVTGTWREPTVEVEEIEPHAVLETKPACDGEQAPMPSFVRRTMSGGVSGLMWDNFKRIHRPDYTP